MNKFEKPVREKREYKETRRTYEKPARENIERNNTVESVREDLIIGRNAVMEALKSDKTIEALYVTKGQREGSINAILSLAKENRVVIKEVDKKKLDSMSNGEVHQGAIAVITPYKYFEVKDILDAAKEKGESPFIVILDELEDPHNLGSIIRTAETCGVHGIIIPKRRNVGVTPTVYKSSVGAVEHVKIAKVTNINATIDELKEEGIWVYGADIEGKEYSYEVDFSGPCALIIGSEGRGISKLTLKKCDKLVKIPMIGRINSLNASVAGGIMMYEVLKGRLK
ncbi:23S rRNA (guanosine(2251)-2'-O)-methyltransferase RlmB [Clostridium baratii]|nr:23S rRNA (guanosine(2251)-2'-O)-methyltransferase RlmB [Clostridium baratii]OPF54252.1 23S rRNA (guanosine(2251)-2'-O)-methyltransferase RlmB [Clostridium baratii]OPF54269.1 23S rRNA (guanosine(2251)-2'-O)-methyltransferase RlmB [Clostridium baratii]OPF58829.1 23S rRNA (guanosine(2251)-2'-O)-methyltransferase RlmB [Clostridium baratii]